MTSDATAPGRRDFAAWSAAGAGLYVLATCAGALLLHEDGVAAIFRSGAVVATVGLGLALSMACIGFSNRKRRFNVRNFRNFGALYALAIAVCLLAVWALRRLMDADAVGAMGVSERIAAGTGLALGVFALLGLVAAAAAHRGDAMMDADVAEELRENGRSLFYSWLWVAAVGAALVVLGVAGPGGLLSPGVAVTGAVILLAVATALSLAVWRLMDELGRTLSHETGNMTLYLILFLGGGWALLAHLGFVAGPAPLDWLTMFTVLMFAAGFIAVGRRRLLTR